MITIRVTGPESCGKTTLSEALQKRLGGILVPEAARTYLKGKSTYKEEDLLNIAQLQHSAEMKAREQGPDFLIADTDMHVLSIWYQEKYGKCHAWIEGKLGVTTYDVTLLCAPDLPWEADAQRENPRDRDRLFSIYEEQLRSIGTDYFIVKGRGEERLNVVLNYIKQKGHIT